MNRNTQLVIQIIILTIIICLLLFIAEVVNKPPEHVATAAEIKREADREEADRRRIALDNNYWIIKGMIERDHELELIKAGNVTNNSVKEE